jgi:hypothetical protein
MQQRPPIHHDGTHDRPCPVSTTEAVAVVFGLFFVLFILFALVSLGLLIWALTDLLRRPTSDFTHSGQDRLLWALVVVFVGLIGPILYLTIARPKLDDQSRGLPPLPIG